MISRKVFITRFTEISCLTYYYYCHGVAEEFLLSIPILYTYYNTDYIIIIHAYGKNREEYRVQYNRQLHIIVFNIVIHIVCIMYIILLYYESVHFNFMYMSSICGAKYDLTWGRFILNVGVNSPFCTEKGSGCR